MPQPTDAGDAGGSTADAMSERRVAIASAIGLHARPASVFAAAAADTGIAVTLVNAAGKSVNAASILGVLSLGVAHGEVVTLRAKGASADAALDTLVAVLRTDFDLPQPPQ